ncbi:TraB/GumN family protein [Sphingomonas bacterium]|uniref:TraB/GumN family protein n=1 Tax=Sphingomonas bacterium TaxID=1895847 RepID=UPI0020C6064B|nr:TraB/GumN family protein [Sphingomonas bacterium]
MTSIPLRAALTAIALTLALPACAQKASTPPAPAAHQVDPALWVVKDKDTTIYLFGTIHVLKPGLSWFDRAVKTAFDRSGEVVLELILPDQQVMQGLVMADGVAKPGTPPLSDQLPADKRGAYAKAVSDLGLPANALDKYKPWLAATQLSVAPLSKLGYDSANGPEQVITAAANTGHKPLIGLETAQQQLGYFASLSDKAQVQFLVSTLDELPTAAATMETMVDDWAHGKPEALADEMNDSLKDSPEVKQVLLVDRNKRWAGWIENRLKTPGTVFIAVGAGHLSGSDSVLAQLAKDGVKTARVKY